MIWISVVVYVANVASCIVVVAVSMASRIDETPPFLLVVVPMRRRRRRILSWPLSASSSIVRDGIDVVVAAVVAGFVVATMATAAITMIPLL